ncbi:MAG: class I SAM-dependent methyltransferase [Candidatus Margulisiibacteriota bacterium]|nr:class I SAM-dependent methyltransferase [Candidatus Margulisiibacteriota bacterium]
MSRREFFDKHAENWDENITVTDTSKIDYILKMADIRTGEMVLDIGCGTGVILPNLKKMVGKQGRVTALDISPKMLARAREKFADSFDYVEGDVHFLPFKEKRFDKVVCFNAFPHFQDKPKALFEIFKVLRPKGVFTVAHSASREEINALHKEVGNVVKNDRIPDEEKMYVLFKEAGFINIRIIDSKDLYLASGIKNTGL